ncbi:unnamed protein product [Sphagnum compactum]
MGGMYLKKASMLKNRSVEAAVRLMSCGSSVIDILHGNMGLGEACAGDAVCYVICTAAGKWDLSRIVEKEAWNRWEEATGLVPYRNLWQLVLCSDSSVLFTTLAFEEIENDVAIQESAIELVAYTSSPLPPS